MLRFCSLFFVSVAVFGLLSEARAVTGDPPGPVYRFDLTSLYDLDLTDPAQARKAWDTMHLVASLQGNVNRSGPVLLIRFMAETDDFWFDHLRQQGNWLAGRPVREIRSLEELLTVFQDQIRGIVLYNEDVRATSNLASTIAGIEERICLRYDPAPGSVYSRVMAMNLPWDDVLRLFQDGASLWGAVEAGEPVPGTHPPLPSTGSAKGDAYQWAKQRYLDAGRTSDEFLAYYIDSYWLEHPKLASLENFTLSNHDFFISQRAFFFDLGVWGDEAPVDEPEQPVGVDRTVLEAILASMAEQAEGRILHIGGFTPWMWKYTTAAPGDSRHGPVATEWEKNKLASKYNAVIDSDALELSGMANASFYQHHPLQEEYPQPPRPSEEELRAEGLLDEEGNVAPFIYVMFYQGDYDSAAWLNRQVPRWWADPARGQIPQSWAFNPNLDRRAPHAIHYVRTHPADNEWFIAGDSGAGYLNPGMLFARNRGAGFGDGWKAWTSYCRNYYEKYDLSITGFVIDGASPGMGTEGLDSYLTFSEDGLIGQKIPKQGLHRGKMPFIRMGGDFHQQDSLQAAERIVEATANLTAPAFLPLRTILKSPSWHKATMEQVAALPGGDRVRFLDAYRFMLLLKRFEQTKQTQPLAPGPFSDVARIRFAPGSGFDGLAPIAADDGPFEETRADDGQKIIRQKRSDEIHYLYFRVGDGFGRSLERGVGVDLVVTISILDTDGGKVGLQYNSLHESYRAAAEPVDLGGTGRWRTVSFNLNEARFDHSQNGGASFRLVNFGSELIVGTVSVHQRP